MARIPRQRCRVLAIEPRCGRGRPAAPWARLPCSRCPLASSHPADVAERDTKKRGADVRPFRYDIVNKFNSSLPVERLAPGGHYGD
jgi:hypothetical protein